MTDEEMAIALANAYSVDYGGTPTVRAPVPGGWLAVLAEARRLLVSPEAAKFIDKALAWLARASQPVRDDHDSACFVAYRAMQAAAGEYEASLRPLAPPPRYYVGPGGIIMDNKEHREVPIERMLAALNASDAAARTGEK